MRTSQIHAAILVTVSCSIGSGLSLAQAPPTFPPSSQAIFYDANGLIIHHGPNGEFDGGDTSQREGWYWLGVWLRQNTPGLQPWTEPRALTFDEVLDQLEPAHDGVFYRHPTLPPWNDPHGKAYGYSRDQMEPMVAAMGVWGRRDAARRLWDALPEDLLGKHAFNGNWRNLLGQEGRDCSAIKRRACDPDADCTLKHDNRDCSPVGDRRDCNLRLDDRDCSLSEDTRDCNPQWGCRSCDGWDAANPACHTERLGCEADKARYRAQCELEKGGQNGIYKAEHDACEAGKVGQNTLYKAQHDACEVEKASANASFKLQHDACEGAKAGQNLAYKAEHDACELAKPSSKAACEAQKATDHFACILSNVHSGDIVGPMTVNLFRRAMGENPEIPLSALRLPAVNSGGGALGEAELALNVGIRLAAADRDWDDTGDDLNLIVKLLMARLNPTTVSEAAANLYAASRPHSYGSFLGTYLGEYGEDATDIRTRIHNGIGAGWQPDTLAIIGAVRWYHRKDTGANPRLADLYDPIIARYLAPPAP